MSCCRSTALPRLLGSGVVTTQGEVSCWTVSDNGCAVEKAPQRPLLSTLPEDSDEKIATLPEISSLVVGLNDGDVNQFWDDKNEKNRRISLTMSSSTSSTVSVCSSDDDRPSEQSNSSSCDKPNVRKHKITLLDADIYGQRHPVESETLIKSKLLEFGSSIKKLGPSRLKNVSAAELRCPELVSACFKLVFLRCECFDAEVR